MIVVRSILFNLLFYAMTAILCILALPVLLGSRRTGAWLGRFWSATTLALLRWTVGLGYEVRGWENLPASPCVIAVKHQSAWDTFAVGVIFRDPAIVIKRELRPIPFYGWYLRKAGMIFVDRLASNASLRAMLAAARQAVAENRPIVIFPEGTRSAVGAALPYRPGVAALARDLRLPLVPVALNSGLFWGRRQFLKRPGRITVEILPPLAPDFDRRRLAEELRRRIETATASLVAESRPERG